MFAADVEMKPGTRAFLGRHAVFLESLSKKSSWYVTSLASYVDGLDEVPPPTSKGDDQLILFAGAMRYHAARDALRESAVKADARAGGGHANRSFVDYAGIIEGYVAEKGLGPARLFEMTVTPGATEAETDLARAIVQISEMAAHKAIRTEMDCHPAWRHAALRAAIERTGKALTRPFEAATVIGVLDDLDGGGPSDMFRVMVRHHAGLPDPRGLSDEDRVACALTRRSLAAVGLLDAVTEDLGTLLELASAPCLKALGIVADSLNAWLADDPVRWERIESYPLRLPPSRVILAELAELGFVETHRRSVRLTRSGAEACQRLFRDPVQAKD